MSEYISREAFLEKERRLYCQDCSRRKNSKGKIVYEIGDAPCRACGIGDVLDDLEDIPAADVRVQQEGGKLMYEVLIAHLRECAKLDTSNNTYTEAANAIEKMSEAYDKLSRHMDDLAALMPRWIPVSERLPKYGERVLVFGGVTMYVAYYDKNRYGGESWHKLNSKSHYCNPTHWMPLPKEPEDGDA